MKKFFLMLQLAALTAGSSAFALTGGPFENSDHGILLERGSFYQATYSFKNGNGYSLWTADNALQSNTAGATLERGSLITPASGRITTDHQANRTVVYYKGVVFVGSAFGEVDLEAREIMGQFNTTSDLSGPSSGQSVTPGGGGFFAVTSGAGPQNSTGSVVSTGRSFIANGAWEGKIYQRSPTLRFRGRGEIAVASPNPTDTVAALAVDGYTRLIQAIATSVASTGSNLVFPAGLYADASLAINNALTSLGPFLANVNPTSSYGNTEHTVLRVRGVRRFF